MTKEKMLLVDINVSITEYCWEITGTVAAIGIEPYKKLKLTISSSNKQQLQVQQQQQQQWKSALLFGFGLYLGLSFFGTTRVNGETREGSSYLQDLKDNLDRTSRMSIAPIGTETHRSGQPPSQS